jgi:hypothetical protein
MLRRDTACEEIARIGRSDDVLHRNAQHALTLFRPHLL